MLHARGSDLQHLPRLSRRNFQSVHVHALTEAFWYDLIGALSTTNLRKNYRQSLLCISAKFLKLLTEKSFTNVVIQIHQDKLK